MNQLFSSHFTWWQLLTITLLLIVIYFVLYLTREIIRRISSVGQMQLRLKKLFRQTFIVYELLALVILGSVFVGINPFLHGVILLFLLLGSLPYIRSYIRGRWIHFDNVIQEGVELKSNDLQGVVAKMGRIKMRLQTIEGLHDLSYSQLLNNGYTLVAGEEIGGFYHLELTAQEEINDIKNHRLHLLDLLASTPYVDWQYKPEILPNESQTGVVHTSVLIKEESHLHELMALIREWGYNCKQVAGQR